ncbi:hypothetical protein [Paenibacillus sp. FSL H7-0716]
MERPGSKGTAGGIVGKKVKNSKGCWRNRRRDCVGSERLLEGL